MSAIDLPDVKWQLRVSGTSQDAQLAKLIDDAQDYVQRYTGLLLEEQEIEETVHSPDRLRLRAWPIAADTIVALTYVDDAGVERPQIGFDLDTSRRPARLTPRPGSAACLARPIKVVITAGYFSLPPAIRRALLVLITGYYADREGGATAKAAESSAEAILKKAGFRLPAL